MSLWEINIYVYLSGKLCIDTALKNYRFFGQNNGRFEYVKTPVTYLNKN